MPEATYERKWGNVDTYLIHRKMFAILVLEDNAPDAAPVDVWIKAGAERFLELTDLPGMRPAPYLARAKWVATRTPQNLDAARWQALVRHSYEQVVRGLPLYQQRALGFEAIGRPRTPKGRRS
jgi:predicted DNA-binding protein (MmcQ/YjbR family)